jgi:hypothetical protein
MSNMQFCVVRLQAGVRELPRCHWTFRESTLQTRTGKIRSVIAIDGAKLAKGVSAYFLSRRELADLRDAGRPAGRSQQAVDILSVVMASDTNGGHLGGFRSPACN